MKYQETLARSIAEYYYRNAINRTQQRCVDELTKEILAGHQDYRTSDAACVSLYRQSLKLLPR